jgi:hypothetical protein
MSTALNNRPFRIILKQGTDAHLHLANTWLQQAELAFTTDTQQVWICVDAANTKMPLGGPRITLPAVTANTTATVPAGYVIDDVFIQETAGNAVTGGIKIGTVSGGTQIAASIAVPANSFTRTLPGSLTTSGPFSPTLAQTIYIQAVTAWNAANVNIIIPLNRAIA